MLLLRITLGIAILAAVAATALIWVQVRPGVTAIIEKRNEFERQASTERSGRMKATKELGETKNKLESTEKNLAETTSQKNAAEARSNELDTQSKALTTQLNQTKEDLTGTQQKLAQWNALGLVVDQVKVLVSDVKNLKDTNVALEEEKKLLNKENTRLTRELDLYRGTNELAVVLKPGTKGRVLVVDPKWDFVVIDVGANQELLPNGVLMVSRDGKLIGKVKVSTVQHDRAIANILPGWKLQDILEGDQVFY